MKRELPIFLHLLWPTLSIACVLYGSPPHVGTDVFGVIMKISWTLTMHGPKPLDLRGYGSNH